MSRLPRRAALALLAGAVLAGCSDVIFEGGGPVSITIGVEPAQPRAGQEARLTYDAVGKVLVAIVMEFGDGTADTVDTSGAQTAKGYFLHTFSAPGSFSVTGTAYDNLQGPASDQLVVQVTAGQ